MSSHDIYDFASSYLKHLATVKEAEKLVGKINLVTEMYSTLSAYGSLTLDSIAENPLTLKKEVETKMPILYDKFIRAFDGRSPQAVSERLGNPNFCFTGGFGHRIILSTRHSSHHWCVKPEFYETVKPSAYELLVFRMMKHTVNVSPVAAMEKWGN